MHMTFADSFVLSVYLQEQMLTQAVEDVFSSPAVLLSTLENPHISTTAAGSTPDAPQTSSRSASATAAGAVPDEPQTIDSATAAGRAPEEPPAGCRGGAAEPAHDLDLALINALYTALLKARALPLSAFQRKPANHSLQ
jgi:hypothetical protein